VFVIAAVGNLANGFWMLADPAGWYAGLPAAVPDFGPLNEHFVRDIGCVFVLLGIALLWAAFTPSVRVPMLVVVTLFYVLHALVHVYDTARGLVGSDHWTIDLPGVYLPAVILLALTIVLARRETAP
jgi:predicted anti-sigma-YlaC factor YlaD